MKRQHSPGASLLVCIVGVVAGSACSDDASPGGQPLGNSSSSDTTTASGPTSGGQVSSTAATTGGGVTQTTGGSTTTGTQGGMTSSGSGGAGNVGTDTVATNGTGGMGTTGTGSETTSSGTGGTTSASSTASATSGGGTGGVFTGTCTESEGAGVNASGTGPYDVVVETNSDDGIRCGTIYRPATLGGDEKFPIFVWGEGGCSQDGLSNRAAMAEIASWGYFIVADGTPGGDNACQGRQNGAAFLDYITWAIAENDKPCSAYYQSLDTTKIAADGFSCGGLMAENVAGDPRFTAIGITSSGLMGPNNALWDSMHAPFKIMNGGSSDIAYQNGLNDYDAIASRGIPILYFSKKSAGHGGDLGQGRGDFNLVNLAWLNWQLKGDEGATGKAFLIGNSCAFCNDSGWDFMSANID